MPSPRRYFRFFAGLALFLVVVVLYTQRAEVEHYRDYVTEHVVGGGAVLREKLEDEQAPLRPAQDAAAPVTTTRPAEPFAAAPATTTSVAAGFGDVYNEVTSTSSLSESTTTATTPTSILAQTLPPTMPGAKHEHDGFHGGVPPASASEEIHWSEQPEYYPVSSTIQLPTGTARPFPRIQYTGGDAGKADTERLAIIKQAATHAWNGYMGHAWGMDEVKPISGGYKNPFNGWAATLVDSMDTLWIMGMEQEFEDAVEFVSELDFTVSLLYQIPLFETTIRYLGGLLGAYDVSGAKYPILLDKAVELGEVLYSAFDTPNRMPQLYYAWRPAFASQPHRASSRVVMAELGSLSVEFTRLAQLTGEPKYYDAVARITDAFEEFQNHTRLPGMWPTSLDASGCGKPAQMAQGPPVYHPQNALPHDLGTGAMVGPPVHQNVDDFTGKPQLTPAHRKAQIDAQDKLNDVVPDKVPAGSTGPSDRLTDNDLSGKPKAQLDGELGSYKAKRQLGVSSSTVAEGEVADASAPPTALNRTYYREVLRRVPPTTAPDTLTGQDVCVPQGLESVSNYMTDVFTLGGQSDSTYEYLPKQYILLGGRVSQYKDMYVAAANAVIENILFRPMTEDNVDILVSGSLHVTINSTNNEYIYDLTAEGEHLTCFAGGMFAMAGKIFNRPGDVQIGKKLTQGCVWAYSIMNSGIMPEIFQAIKCEDWSDCTWNETEYWRMLDPYEEFRTKVYEPQPATTSSQTQSTASTTSIGRNAGIAMSTSSISDAEIAVQTINPVIPEEDRWVDNKVKIAPSPDDVVKEWISESPDAETLGTTFDRWADEVAPADAKVDVPSGPLDKRQLEQADSAAAKAQAKAEAKAGAALDVDHAARPTATRTATTVDPAAETIDYNPIWTPKPPLSHEKFVQQKIADERLPPGIIHIKDRRYILRPEAIESVFYMYRITGEQHWRDAGWQMFTAIASVTKAEFGHAAIDDVTKTAPEQKDSMESFWLAETLKYFYLLFEDADKWSLDEWVLNTEAHLFRRPEVEFLD